MVLRPLYSGKLRLSSKLNPTSCKKGFLLDLSLLQAAMIMVNIIESERLIHTVKQGFTRKIAQKLRIFALNPLKTVRLQL